MDANEVARKLFKLGERERALLHKLGKVAEERCGLLQQVASEECEFLGLDEPTIAASVAPKEPPPDGEGP